MKSKKVISKKESGGPYSFQQDIDSLGTTSESMTGEKIPTSKVKIPYSPLLLNQTHHSEPDQNSSTFQREALSYSPFAPPDNEYEKY